MPNLLSFLETYQSEGLQLLSVHMPRMDESNDMEVDVLGAVCSS